MNGASTKGHLIQELKKLWKNEIFRAVFLLVLVLLGNFILQEALVLVLGTERPLHTPISGSMEPTLNIGDLLIVQGGLRAQDITAGLPDGDIIVFRNPRDPDGIPIVHRAIDKYQIDGVWYIVTKGDNNFTNPYPDDWYPYFPRGGIYDKAGHPESYVIGKVVVSIPMLGYALRLLDETGIRVGGYIITLRMVMIVFLVAAIFFVEYVSSSERTEEKKKKKSKNEPPSMNGTYKILYKGPLTLNPLNFYGGGMA